MQWRQIPPPSPPATQVPRRHCDSRLVPFVPPTLFFSFSFSQPSQGRRTSHHAIFLQSPAVANRLACGLGLGCPRCLPDCRHCPAPWLFCVTAQALLDIVMASPQGPGRFGASFRTRPQTVAIASSALLFSDLTIAATKGDSLWNYGSRVAASGRSPFLFNGHCCLETVSHILSVTLARYEPP
ncbi:hypothetical protein BS50DRAFT_108795 [Corynespora cassiicola Philippines]|uniref:Uncharacterized protein n=1 Tax=Corynespora cassiicola Philippines TaxID=1448308 RepID=A0A2T2ND12_CORCC|nr:hypothetical protein BS50DRAFT_108795 [Corynespora cassiicola Philippines]